MHIHKLRSQCWVCTRFVAFPTCPLSHAALLPNPKPLQAMVISSASNPAMWRAIIQNEQVRVSGSFTLGMKWFTLSSSTHTTPDLSQDILPGKQSMLFLGVHNTICATDPKLVLVYRIKITLNCLPTFKAQICVVRCIRVARQTANKPT